MSGNVVVLKCNVFLVQENRCFLDELESRNGEMQGKAESIVIRLERKDLFVFLWLQDG